MQEFLVLCFSSLTDGWAKKFSLHFLVPFITDNNWDVEIGQGRGGGWDGQREFSVIPVDKCIRVGEFSGE